MTYSLAYGVAQEYTCREAFCQRSWKLLRTIKLTVEKCFQFDDAAYLFVGQSHVTRSTMGTMPP
eukprot:631056-Amphidinium_carterae.3